MLSQREQNNSFGLAVTVCVKTDQMLHLVLHLPISAPVPAMWFPLCFWQLSSIYYLLVKRVLFSAWYS